MTKRGVARISVSVSPELLKEFDATVKRMGFDRSKAVQAAMRNFLTDFRLQEGRGTVAGALVMVYDHKVKGLEETLTDLQHRFESVISSTMHIHLSKHNCLEIVAVRGEVKKIQALAQELMTERGVKQLKQVIVMP